MGRGARLGRSRDRTGADHRPRLPYRQQHQDLDRRRRAATAPGRAGQARPRRSNRGLARGGYDVQAIRVRHLLNHTAGLREHISEDRLRRHGANPDRVWTAREQLDLAMAAGTPLTEPGAEFHYSDTGYILLGAMIERYTGQPLHAALRAMQRWDALGLQRTWFETHEPARAPQAQQYWAGQPIRHWHPSFDLYGGGGLLATPADRALHCWPASCSSRRPRWRSSRRRDCRTPGTAMEPASSAPRSMANDCSGTLASGTRSPFSHPPTV